MRGAIAIVAASTVALLLAALPVTATADTRRGGTLTVLNSGDVDTIDPGATYDVFGSSVANATQRALLTFRPEEAQTPVPDLAASPPEVAPDAMSVTVHLRPGVRFSPPVNREVTSRDVKYAIERGFFRTVATPYADIYFGDLIGARAGAEPGTAIPGLETPDDRTLILRLTRPRGGLVAGALVMPLTAPVPPEYAAPFDRATHSTYGRHQVATGPYMIRNDARGNAVGYRRGRRIELVRNPNWVAATDIRPAFLDRIVVSERNPDTSRASRRILSGRALVSGNFGAAPDVVRRERARRRSQFSSVSGGGVNFITLNTRLAPFNNVDVRRAVVAGSNRAAWRRVSLGVTGGPIATHFLPPGTPGFHEAGGLRGPGLDFLAHAAGSRRVASRYLRRAGFRSGRYTGHRAIIVVTVTDPAARPGDRRLRRDLGRLGFHVRFRRLSPERAFAVCSTTPLRVHVCQGGFVRDFADPETILSPLFNGASIVARGNSNVAQLNDPAVNAAMTTAQALVDAQARAQAWGAIDRQVTALAPAIPTLWPTATAIRSRGVAGAPSHSLPGVWDLSFTGLRS
jgi:peptide/nickel transport system substrate-binding protein